MVLIRSDDREDTKTAAQVRAARALLSWSQRDLAARSGVAPRTLADLETGRRIPRGETLEKLVGVLRHAGIELVGTDGSFGVMLKPLDQEDRG